MQSDALNPKAAEPAAPARDEIPAARNPYSIEVDAVDFHYGPKKALENISLQIARNEVTAFIGPSGCGKSTLLRCFNRMNDKVPGARVTSGQIRVEDRDVHSPEINPAALRRDVGMVFQKSNPFPASIYENVAYGLRIAGQKKKEELDQRVEESLRGAALWDEVKDRLRSSAFGLSGGQQQRLCIARAIAVKPRVLLMDEPCSALDPIATARVEELILSMKENFTIVIVTHNLQQAARVSEMTAFFYLGKLVEYAQTAGMFIRPGNPVTERYLSGMFG